LLRRSGAPTDDGSVMEIVRKPTFGNLGKYPAGKYRSSKGNCGAILGFNTLITPSAKASKAHTEEVGRIITKHRSSPQSALITEMPLQSKTVEA